MIPKIIHYCWFGYNKKSRLIKKCIASWREYFPEYEIKEWNESNTNLEENEYIKQAYKQKKWAFVSDFVRMKVLYEYGGIYFDTDVEVIKPFPNEILCNQSFTGFESCSGLVNPGLVYACKPYDKIVAGMLESYQRDVFKIEKTEHMKTINVRITELLSTKGLRVNDELQRIEGVAVYPSRFFCAYDGERRRVDITEETLSVHHYAGSWLPWYRKVQKLLGTIKRRIIYKNSGMDI